MIKTIIKIIILNVFLITVYLVFFEYLSMRAKKKAQISVWSKDLKYKAYEIWKLCHKCEKCNSFIEYQYYRRELLIEQKHFSFAIGILYAAGYKRVGFYEKYCSIMPKIPSLNFI